MSRSRYASESKLDSYIQSGLWMDYGLTYRSAKPEYVCYLIRCASVHVRPWRTKNHAGRRDCLAGEQGALESRQKRMTSLKPRYPARNMLTRVRTRTYLHRAQLPSKDDINSFINNADFEAFVNLTRPSDWKLQFPIYFPLLTASTRMKRVI